MARYLIKNWDHYQHYRDRNPPWIKLHYEILSSSDWVILDDTSRVLAVACMLVASRSKGEIDASESGLAYLKRVAYLNTPPNLKPLISSGFLTMLADASALQANDTQETEAYKERHIVKEETDTSPGQQLITKKAKKPKGQLTTLPDDFAISPAVADWAKERGYTKLDQRLEDFKDAAISKGYKYANWDYAFRRAIRDDWAKLGGPTQPTQTTTQHSQTPQPQVTPHQSYLHRLTLEQFQEQAKESEAAAKDPA